MLKFLSGETLKQDFSLKKQFFYTSIALNDKFLYQKRKAKSTYIKKINI